MSSTLKDVLIAVRSLRRTPLLSLAVLLTLGLGIGANTAMFTVVRSVLLRPLPFPESASLVRLGTFPSTAEQVEALSQLESVQAMTALGADSMILQHDGAAIELRGLLADGNHYEVFGVAPLLGRGLSAQDSMPGAEPVVVLGHHTWTRYFGADPNVIGKVLPLSRTSAKSHTIVGVQTPDYQPGPWQADFITPHRYEAGSHDWTDMARFWAVGRLSAGMDPNSTVATVQAEARSLAASLAEEARVFDREMAASLVAQPLLEARIDRIKQKLWLLSGVLLVVLLIGCANVANLILVRQMARQREFSVRSALGAGRGRLVGQMVTEGLVLAMIGGLLGIAVAVVLLPAVLAALPDALPRGDEIRFDPWVAAFAGLLSTVVGLVFGLAPVLRLGKAANLARAGVGDGGKTSRRLNDSLVAAQLALSVVLLSSCVLLVRSMVQLQEVDPGFEVEQLHALRLSPPVERYGEEQDRVAYYQRLEAVSAVPGVVAVGSISNLPLTPTMLGVGISPDGQALPDGKRALMINYRAVTPGYTKTAGVPVLRGRGLEPTDRAGAEPVGLINRRLAERLWPGADPLGEKVFWGTGEPWFTVVGVLGDVHQVDLATEVAAEAYLPYAQEAWVRGLHVLARAAPGFDVATDLRAAILSVDPLVPITDQRTMTEVLKRSLATASFNASFFSAFALLGLLLSAIGVYGVTLFVVSQRASELGLRMALGADSRRLVTLLVSGNLPAVALGVLAGLVLSLFVTRSLETFLFAVRPYDPTVMATVVAVLAGGALFVSGVAARRAAHLEPTRVLRQS